MAKKKNWIKWNGHRCCFFVFSLWLATGRGTYSCQSCEMESHCFAILISTSCNELVSVNRYTIIYVFLHLSKRLSWCYSNRTRECTWWEIILIWYLMHFLSPPFFFLLILYAARLEDIVLSTWKKSDQKSTTSSQKQKSVTIYHACNLYALCIKRSRLRT